MTKNKEPRKSKAPKPHEQRKMSHRIAWAISVYLSQNSWFPQKLQIHIVQRKHRRLPPWLNLHAQLDCKCSRQQSFFLRKQSFSICQAPDVLGQPGNHNRQVWNVSAWIYGLWEHYYNAYSSSSSSALPANALLPPKAPNPHRLEKTPPALTSSSNFPILHIYLKDIRAQSGF